MHRRLLLVVALALPIAAFAEDAAESAADQETGAAAVTEAHSEDAAAPAAEGAQQPTDAPAQDSQPASQDE